MSTASTVVTRVEIVQVDWSKDAVLTFLSSVSQHALERIEELQVNDGWRNTYENDVAMNCLLSKLPSYES